MTPIIRRPEVPAQRDTQPALLGGLWLASETVYALDGSNRTVTGESVTVLPSNLMGALRCALSS